MKTKIWGCILGAVMFASALQSCQTQVEIPDGAVYPILFGSTETRAVADLDDLKNNGFKVYAYFTGSIGSSSFANNVKHAEGLDVWSFETPEYWIPDTKYWFKAIYPTELPAGTLTVNQDTSAQNFTIENFDVVNHQVDIMLAEATASVDKGATVPTTNAYVNGSVVNLTFQHLLACIEVQMKSAISNVTITKITLVNADNDATYQNGAWNAEGSGDIEIEPEDGGLSSSEDKSITNGGILVIPGESSGKSFKIETNINKTYIVNITSPTTWDKGNKYTYTAEIKQNNIVFNEPTVDEWDSENATGSVIIK